MRNESDMPINNSGIYHRSLIPLSSFWKLLAFILAYSLAITPGYAASLVGSLTTVHELKFGPNIKDRDVYNVHADIRTGEHGIYLVDDNCTTRCKDILTLVIPDKLRDDRSIKRLLHMLYAKSTVRHGVTYKHLTVTPIFTKIPDGSPINHYRVSAVNVVGVVF